jgi:hypothetical protein
VLVAVVGILTLGSDEGGHPAATPIDLPPNTDVFQHPLDEIVQLLGSKGLTVSSSVDGCSNSTDPGLVRQVTVGSTLDQKIVYGKEASDSIDEQLRNQLARGTAVTVWTPSQRPC